MNIAVIGYGYWGPNLARNFASLEGAHLKTVCDTSRNLLKKALKNHPSVSVSGSFEEVLKDSSIDAVCIATPALNHADLSIRALRAGKHVLVEKPMATTVSDCEKMMEEAGKRGLTLMVDHTFPYAGPVRKLRELSSSGSLGSLYYFDSVRVNLGILRSDVNVLWDLAVHDLSILFQVAPAIPVSVSASGVSHIQGEHIDTAYLTLHYSSKFIAHVHVSWLAPVKLRLTTISGNRSMAVYDDTESTEKLKIYDSGVDVSKMGKESLEKLLVDYRTGDITVPKLDSSEPLSMIAEDFRNAVCDGKAPLVSAEDGALVVRILECADKSIRENGARIPL